MRSSAHGRGSCHHSKGAGKLNVHRSAVRHRGMNEFLPDGNFRGTSRRFDPASQEFTNLIRQILGSTAFEPRQCLNRKEWSRPLGFKIVRRKGEDSAESGRGRCGQKDRCAGNGDIP